MTEQQYTETFASYAARTERSLDTLLSGMPDSIVLEAMRYSLLGGGKRIRAVMALSACEMLGGDMDSALLAADAVEMLHCYSLIHDDLPCMDDDALRRGKPSCHMAFGEANALLAGDALLTAAFETLSRIADKGAVAGCVGILARAAGHCGMIYGQELDLYYEGRRADETVLRKIDAYKTGALIEASVLMGAACAKTDEAQTAALRVYAQNIGAAFQIVDDILDVTSSAEALGKPTGSDDKNEKNTFVSLLGLAGARAAAQRCTVDAAQSLGIFDTRAEFLHMLADQLLQRTN
ncbi:MAG: farnesyl diphosphate synthase [Oscillospiraceae bacterium]|nr:farnesyl diphosphate synthase [Oscillospiraceae bacterium]